MVAENATECGSGEWGFRPFASAVAFGRKDLAWKMMLGTTGPQPIFSCPSHLAACLLAAYNLTQVLPA